MINFAALYFLFIPFLILHWVAYTGSALVSLLNRKPEFSAQSSECAYSAGGWPAFQLPKRIRSRQRLVRFSPDRKRSLKLNSLSTRIYGGYEAPRSTYLYTAYVNTTFADGNFIDCTGSIVDCRRILTAAHCFQRDNDSISNITVRLGQFRNTGALYTAASAHIHRRFAPHPPQEDVALLTVVGTFRGAYRYVSLLNWTDEPPLYVRTAGFGRTESQFHSPVLLETTQRTQNFSFCQSKYMDLEYDERIEEFTASQALCVTDPAYPVSGNRSFCFGDSGGPVFVKKRGRMLQLGVVSFGPVMYPCNYSKSVDWAVNLKSYINDIQEHLSRNFTNWRQVLWFTSHKPRSSILNCNDRLAPSALKQTKLNMRMRAKKHLRFWRICHFFAHIFVDDLWLSFMLVLSYRCISHFSQSSASDRAPWCPFSAVRYWPYMHVSCEGQLFVVVFKFASMSCVKQIVRLPGYAR